MWITNNAPFNSHTLNAPINTPYITNKIAPKIFILLIFFSPSTKNETKTNSVANIPIASYILFPDSSSIYLGNHWGHHSGDDIFNDNLTEAE